MNIEEITDTGIRTTGVVEIASEPDGISGLKLPELDGMIPVVVGSLIWDGIADRRPFKDWSVERGQEGSSTDGSGGKDTQIAARGLAPLQEMGVVLLQCFFG